MRLRLVVIAAVMLASGCASQPDAPDTALQPTAGAPPTAAPAGVAAIAPAPGGYKLTPLEEKLDCAKLTGQMRVRIANMRAAFGQSGGTLVGRAAQTVVTPVLGGSRRGIDATADLATDRAKLEAFNRRLAEKKCKPLDIDAELNGQAPAAPAKEAPKKAG